MASNHMATALLTLVEWWLENQIGKIYKALILDGIRSAVASA
jgi:hypothetical protein